MTPIGRVRAEYDYEAQQEEELSFQEDDEMDLLETDDPDWYLVKRSNGHIGLVPSNYVQTIDEHQASHEQYREEAITLQAAAETTIYTPPAPQVPITAPPTTQVSVPPVQPILSQRVHLQNYLIFIYLTFLSYRPDQQQRFLEKLSTTMHNHGASTNMMLRRKRRRKTKAVCLLATVCFVMEARQTNRYLFSSIQSWMSSNTFMMVKFYTLKLVVPKKQFWIFKLLPNQKRRLY